MFIKSYSTQYLLKRTPVCTVGHISALFNNVNFNDLKTYFVLKKLFNPV